MAQVMTEKERSETGLLPLGSDIHYDLGIVNSRLKMLEETLNKVELLVLALVKENVHDPAIRDEVMSDVLETNEVGAVKLRQIDEFKIEMRAKFRGDQEALSIVQSTSDFYLWRAIAPSDEVIIVLEQNAHRATEVLKIKNFPRNFLIPCLDLGNLLDTTSEYFKAPIETLLTEPYSASEISDIVIAELKRQLDTVRSLRARRAGDDGA